MFKIDLIVVGKVKKGPWNDLQQDYIKRLKWPLTITEVESKYSDPKTQQEHEQRLILSKLDEDFLSLFWMNAETDYAVLILPRRLKKSGIWGHQKYLSWLAAPKVLPMMSGPVRMFFSVLANKPGRI